MTARTLYSYNAGTGQAQVYSRLNGAVLCDVNVSMEVWHLLRAMADEMHEQGVEMGRNAVLDELARFVERRRG